MKLVRLILPFTPVHVHKCQLAYLLQASRSSTWHSTHTCALKCQRTIYPKLEAFYPGHGWVLGYIEERLVVHAMRT